MLKSKKLLATLIVMSMVSTTLLVGCKKDEVKETSKDNSTSQEIKMDKEQFLNIVLGAEPKTLDQSKSTDSVASQVLTNTQEALTRITVDKDGKDKIVEGGAKEWKQSEDGLKWTFTLRDAKWSDGKPITAKDYVYGITRTLDQKTGSQYAFLLYPIKNANEFNTGKAKVEDLGIKAVDDKTIEFTLNSPCAYFLDLTYFKVMQPQREDILTQHGEMYGAEANTMVFSGPFIIKNWVHNNAVELEKNPEYWDAKNVKLEKVTMKIIKEETSRMNELYNGSLDSAGVSKQEWIDKFNGTGKFDVKKGYDGTGFYTLFNQKNKLFSNEKVRKAFIIAEDREGVAKTLYRGLAEPAYAWCPPGIQIDGKDFRDKVNHNLVEELKKQHPDAKALLVEGLKELGLDPDPSKINIKYLESGTDARAKEFAEFAQQNYKSKLGINVECEYVEWAVFQKKTEQYEFEIAGSGWTGDYNDPNTFFDLFISNAGITNTGWTSEKYDNLIKDAAKTTDMEKRTNLFKDAERLLVYEDGVISPRIWRFKNTFIRKYVKNYAAPTFGTIDLKYTYTEGRE